ncbi:PaaX family transcriptional regulator C-terminal domain-containing protein [Palleronia marisminoris]|nr:PaaX family transcriptional regulator C-terminal domain-containing protein [Palleronia marisminoris]
MTDIPILALARDILNRPAPRASSFIVTIYGDIAAPRGGTLWMGSMIECCARQGISESLVRTAVSRLVAAGRLEGERVGRRSYYRLTPAAQAEFSEAARILYSPPPPARGWLLALGPQRPDSGGWAALGPVAALAPNRADILRPPDVPVLSTDDLPPEALSDTGARLWPIEDVAGTYRAFLDVFGPLTEALGDTSQLDGATALALRLRLVDAYRRAALPDPRLPPSALPQDWPGTEARDAFVSIYVAVAETADAEIGRSFGDKTAPLPLETPATRDRISRLLRVADQ